MKKFIAVLALSAFIASPSFAAAKKTTKKTTTTTTTTTTSQPATEPTTSTPSYTSHSSGQGPNWSADVGLGTAASKFHFGVGVKAQWPVELQGNDFKFGGRTGFYIGPSDPSTWILPIMATAEYDIRTSNALKPYVGLDIGISITHASFMGVSNTGTDFALLFVPGVNFDSKYFFEVPLGTLGSDFAILPSVGMHF